MLKTQLIRKQLPAYAVNKRGKVQSFMKDYESALNNMALTKTNEIIAALLHQLLELSKVKVTQFYKSI